MAGIALLLFGSMFAYVAVQHVLYPGFVEPMEGDSLQHMERIAEGQPAYPLPGAEFIALSYMPLYYTVAVPFYRLFGDSFAGPRLLSVLCTLASSLLVAWIASRHSRTRTAPLLAAALFFGSYRIMDAWFTCALPDTLLLVWLLVGYCFLAYGDSWIHDLLWLVCFTLAFWTKQHGAFFFGFAVVYALLFRKNYLPRWVYLIGMLLGGPVAYFGLGRYLGDGFFDTTLLMPGNWERSVWLSARRTVFVLVEFVPFAILLTLSYLRDGDPKKSTVTLWRSLRELRHARLQAWMCKRQTPQRTLDPLKWFTVTSLLACAVTMMAAGSSNNQYIPFLTFLCVTAAVGADRLASSTEEERLGGLLVAILMASGGMTWVARQEFGQHPIPVGVPGVALLVVLGYCFLRTRRMTQPARAGALALVLTIAQFATGAYWPLNYVPTGSFASDLSRLRQVIAELDGTVIWVPYGNVPQQLTGLKLAHAPSAIALEDVQRQVAAPRRADQALGPFRQRILGARRLYVLCHGPMEDVAVWKTLPVEWELVCDLQTQLAGVGQVASHWFGSSGAPRYIYRKRSIADNVSQASSVAHRLSNAGAALREPSS